MRLKHHVPLRAIEEARRNALPEVVDERYEEELAAACRKAHRTWLAAERRLATIERKIRRTPTSDLLLHRDRIRQEVLARLNELHVVEALMRSAVGGANWSGCNSVRAVRKGRVW